MTSRETLTETLAPNHLTTDKTFPKFKLLQLQFSYRPLVKMRVPSIRFTFNQQPGELRLFLGTDVTLVGSFILLGEVVDGHVTFGRLPNLEAIFIESSREVAGTSLFFTEQSDVVSCRHREDGTLQDH